MFLRILPEVYRYLYNRFIKSFFRADKYRGVYLGDSSNDGINVYAGQDTD